MTKLTKDRGACYSDMRAFLPELITMHDLDPNDGVDAATVSAAIKLLDVLDFAGARCPLVFWHGGDAVVFEWDQKAMITVCDNVSMPLITPAGRTALTKETQDG